jgi:transcription initiation factor TFIIIB Brf1 subunit/transcription initiation factor TFIIB
VPKDVADIVGLPYNKMTKALKKFPKCVGPKHISFISLIPRYCERLGVDKNSITYIQNCGEDLLRKDPELDDDFPQNIAVATILYYLTISGVEINRREYSKTVGLSEVTITNIYKKIMGIDNKMIC